MPNIKLGNLLLLLITLIMAAYVIQGHNQLVAISFSLQFFFPKWVPIIVQ